METERYGEVMDEMVETDRSFPILRPPPREPAEDFGGVMDGMEEISDEEDDGDVAAPPGPRAAR